MKRYQAKTASLRPLLDEIQDPIEPTSIVLQYLDTELLKESRKERLTRPEIKQVAKGVLDALRVLHEDNMVHTGTSQSKSSFKIQCLLQCARVTDLTISDIKLDNIFINYGHDGQRFSTIQLGDCGGVVSADSKYARESHLIGAHISRSPEGWFGIPWGTATDIWSFGNAVSGSEPIFAGFFIDLACPPPPLHFGPETSSWRMLLIELIDYQSCLRRELSRVRSGQRGHQVGRR